MKTLIFLCLMLANFGILAQDTISKTEVIKGKRILIKEIIHEPSFWTVSAKILSIALALVATYVFLFYKSKSDKNG